MDTISTHSVINGNEQKKTDNPVLPRAIPGFRLQKGMTINLHGSIYKVIASRKSGKATIKFIREETKIK